MKISKKIIIKKLDKLDTKTEQVLFLNRIIEDLDSFLTHIKKVKINLNLFGKIIRNGEVIKEEI